MGLGWVVRSSSSNWFGKEKLKDSCVGSVSWGERESGRLRVMY